MTDAKRREMMGELMAAGMDIKEADNFLQHGNVIDQKIVQIPGTKAAMVLPVLARMGLISGVVSVKIGVEHSRADDFVSLLKETCGQEVLQAEDFTGELEKRVEPFKIAEFDDPKVIN